MSEVEAVKLYWHCENCGQSGTQTKLVDIPVDHDALSPGCVFNISASSFPPVEPEADTPHLVPAPEAPL